MRFLKIFGLIGVFAVAVLAGLVILNPNNIAETSADSKDENLLPRIYKTDLQNFISECEKIIPTLSTYGRNWRFVSVQAQDNSAVLKAEVPVMIFTDDLEVRAVYNIERGETSVNFRSASRVGKSDLGENRRHILQISTALDKKFGVIR